MEILLIIIITIIVLIIVNQLCTQSEHLINTDDSRKTELKKCCPKGGICYSKPNFLNEKCDENKKDAAIVLDKSYEQMYTNNEYNSILKKLNIRQDIDNTVSNHDAQELNSFKRPSIDESKLLGSAIYTSMINDYSDTINGYDDMHNLYPNYNKNTVRTMIV
jgi:hypothetical protein